MTLVDRLPDALRRPALPLLDHLKHSQAAALAKGSLELLQYRFGNGSERMQRLGGAVRHLPEGNLRERAYRAMARAIASHADEIVAAHHVAFARQKRGPEINRTVVLKHPGRDGERGVIFCQFEYNWSRLLEGVHDLPRFTEEYDVIWGASWSPTDYLALARILAVTDGPVYLHAANLGEIEPLRRMHERVRVIEQLACEFQDGGDFAPRSAAERDIDLVVVANWAPFKRHWELFQALSELPAELKVVCIGQPETGYDMEHAKDLARLFKAPQQIEFLDSIPLDQVRAIQSRSKAAAVFSRREGQCMAAVEAIFAGASLGLRAGARIGAAAYVNKDTGLFLKPERIAQDLLDLIQNAPTRQPREWALAHLGYQRGTARLNGWLTRMAAERNLPWTTDIVEHWWAPYPWVGDAERRAQLANATAELHRRYPATFPADMLETSRH